jgi:bifunctional ADP-heptose synthase (sugar kinase/adenylyltransferase)
VARCRAARQQVVFTNGVFDLLIQDMSDICSRPARSATH